VEARFSRDAFHKWASELDGQARDVAQAAAARFDEIRERLAGDPKEYGVPRDPYTLISEAATHCRRAPLSPVPVHVQGVNELAAQGREEAEAGKRQAEESKRHQAKAREARRKRKQGQRKGPR